jgi:hypothetical protein
MHYTSFRITDTQDGRYAVEDQSGFVLEGLTKTQARKLKAYLLKLAAEAARPAATTPENEEKMNLAKSRGQQVRPQEVNH